MAVSCLSYVKIISELKKNRTKFDSEAHDARVANSEHLTAITYSRFTSDNYKQSVTIL
jgi:hypothetical protein